MSLKTLKFLCMASAAVLIAACGGGGTTTGGSDTPVVVTGSQSGILTDAAVQGVSYRTSSGVTGITGPNGEYNFNPGDTVQFTLGGLTLGNVTATGIISPIQLAAGDSNKLNNLLVLLQSLDTDGNPNNGITISSATAAAVPTTVNLTQATNTFASSANTGLVSAMTAGGITRSVTSLASATAHFTEQGLVLLSNNVIVMYGTDTAAMLRILPNGSYLIGEASPDDYCGAEGDCGEELIGTAGSERGTVSVTGFSTTGYQISATAVIDNNLQNGLSHPVECDSQGFLPNGEGFKINVAGLCDAEPQGELLNKAPNNNSTLVGVWALESPTSANVQHFVFLPNGKYLMVDPLGDTEMDSCGDPGVEFGSYDWNSSTGVLTISNVTYDTNGCAGLNDDTEEGSGVFTGTVVLTNNGQQATVTPTEEAAMTLYRVSK
ncbi:MAG: adhesin [Brachymonas sp.]|nr:adhesin [Brachymonas sp.]